MGNITAIRTTEIKWKTSLMRIHKHLAFSTNSLHSFLAIQGCNMVVSFFDKSHKANKNIIFSFCVSEQVNDEQPMLAAQSQGDDDRGEDKKNQQ